MPSAEVGACRYKLTVRELGLQAGSSEKDLAGTSRGSITFPNLLQFFVFLHRSGRGDPCGPSVLRLPARRCRGGGTHSSSPAHQLPTHGRLGLVVPVWPCFLRMPVAEDMRTTKSNRPRSSLCSDQLPGLVSTAEANLKLQLPGSNACPLFGRLRQGAEAPSVPRSCYYSFSVLTAFRKGPLRDYAFQNTVRVGVGCSLLEVCV